MTFDKDGLTSALSGEIPSALAADLVGSFSVLRRDVATETLERAAPGKFVETLVQVLQHLESGEYDTQPKVDAYLRDLESRSAPIDDGLRICASRVCRAMYSLRSKRNIAHKGDLDPNLQDLKFLLHAAQWTLAELVRSVAGMSMDEAARLVEQVEIPVGGLVEDFGDRKLVLSDMTIRDELLLLLHADHPDPVALKSLVQSLDRRDPGSVRKAIRALWQSKDVGGSGDTGYKLTQRGFRSATDTIRQHLP